MRADLKLLAALAAGLAGFAPGSASAASGPPPGPTAQFYMNYDVTLGNYAVGDLMMFQQGAPNPDPNGYGETFLFSAAANATTTLTDPALKTNGIINNFLMGITTGLPGDASSGQQHLVLFTNDDFATSATGIAFSTLFPSTSEASLIADLAAVADGTESGDTNSPAVDAAFDDIDNFTNGDATGGPNGSIAFGSSDTFTAIAFSGGQVIGHGQAYETTVPEPASWTVLLLAAGLLGPLRRAARRGRRTAS